MPTNNTYQRKALSALFNGPGKRFQMQTFPMRGPKHNEIIARVKLVTICRSDLHSWQGKRSNPTPSILGHEIVGVVEEKGEDIDCDIRGNQISVGDRITWTEFIYCGNCFYCKVVNTPQKCVNVKKYGHENSDIAPHLTGGFAEYCYVLPISGVIRIPDSLTDAEAAPIMCGVPTMVSAVNSVGVGPNDSVVVQGLGLMGLYALALSKSKGAKKIIGIDSMPDRLKLAKQFGADEVVNISDMNESDLISILRSICQPEGADVVIEACGDTRAILQGIDILRSSGRYAITGFVYPNAHVTLDANIVLKKMLTIIGVHNYHPDNLGDALDFVQSNQSKYPFNSLVGNIYNLKDIDVAFKYADSNKVVRVAIIP